MNQRAISAGYELLNPSERISGYESAIHSTTYSEFTIVNAIWQLVVLNHFGYFPKDLRSIVESGVTLVNQFFRDNPTSNPSSSWYSLVSQILPPATILLPKKFNHSLASQLRLDLDPGYVGPRGPAVARFYLLVANYFRETPMPSETIELEIETAKSKHAKLLLALWRMVFQSDQDEYDNALKQSLKYVRSIRRPPLDCTFPAEWIAPEESMIHAIAECTGKQTPKLPDHLACYLVTRKTLANCQFA